MHNNTNIIVKRDKNMKNNQIWKQLIKNLNNNLISIEKENKIYKELEIGINLLVQLIKLMKKSIKINKDSSQHFKIIL